MSGFLAHGQVKCHDSFLDCSWSVRGVVRELVSEDRLANVVLLALACFVGPATGRSKRNKKKQMGDYFHGPLSGS